MTSETDTQTSVEAPVSVDLDHRVNGRYRLKDRLGCGGMGTVYRVEDTHQDNRNLAMKCVRADRADEKVVRSLKQEFLMLSTLRHPNVAAAFEFGRDYETGDTFYTSEYVEGEELYESRSRIDIATPEGHDTCLEIIVQVLRSLSYIHSRQIIHCDLKPQNILVKGIPDGGAFDRSAIHCTLIDFGLATFEKHFTGRKLVGTRSYIAPETIMGSHLDRRSDLYSFGAVIYHLLCGSPPFRGKSSVAILKAHLERDPQPPSERNPRVPRIFDEVILKLLQKQPGDRYQNATEVITAINQVFFRDFPLETPATALAYLHPSRPTGRESHLRQLRGAMGSALRLSSETDEEDPEEVHLRWLLGGEEGHRSLPRTVRFVLLRGDVGAGKRGLLRTLGAISQVAGAHTVWLECGADSLGESGSAPEEDLLRLVRSLASHASSGEMDDIFQQLLEAVAEIPFDEWQEPEKELIDVCADRVLRFSPARPLWLHFQRLEEASPGVARFLRTLLSPARRASLAESRFLITATYGGRTTSATGAAVELDLEGLDDLAGELHLRELDMQRVQRHTEQLFGQIDLTPKFVRRLERDSDGNAAAIHEICTFLLREDLIQRRPTGWQLSEGADSMEFPVTRRMELTRRIRALPREAMNLGIAFAFLGGEADVNLATELARLTPAQATKALAALLENIVIERSPGSFESQDIYSFVQASAQDILYGVVVQDKRRHLHDLAGTLCRKYYEQHGDEDVCKIAHQFLRAGNLEHGIPYGLRAGELNLRRLDLQAAQEKLQSVSNLAPAESSDHLEAVRMLGYVHYCAGAFEDAIRVVGPWLNSEAIETQPIAACRLYMLVTDAYRQLGLFMMAESWVEKATRLRRKSEFQKAGTADVLATRTAISVTRAELSFAQGRSSDGEASCTAALRDLEDVKDPFLKARCFMMLAERAFFGDDEDGAVALVERAIVELDASRDLAAFDLSVFCQARRYKYRGSFDRALVLYSTCAEQRRRRGLVDRWGEALQEMGAINLFLERPRVALRQLREAHRCFLSTKNALSTIKTQNLLAESHRSLGQFSEVAALIDDTEAREKRMGEARHNRWESLLVQGRVALCEGRLAEAAKSFREAGENPPQKLRSAMKVLALQAEVELQSGNFRQALGLTMKGLAETKAASNPLLSTRFLEQRSWLLCRLGQFQSARKLVRVLLDITRQFHFAVKEGRVYFFEGMICQGEGNIEAAKNRFEQAERVFRRSEAESDLACLHLQRSYLNFADSEHEATFLALEETLYLVKKLNLTFLKPQVYGAMALFEAMCPDGDATKAEGYFRHAAKIAAASGYRDLLWQIQFHLGAFLNAQSSEEGSSLLFESLRVRKSVLATVPANCRDSFLKNSPGSDGADSDS